MIPALLIALAFCAWCLWAVWPRGALEGAWLTVVRGDGTTFGARVKRSTSSVITLDRDYEMTRIEGTHFVTTENAHAD